MAENKLGGNNLPEKGEQGFKKSKAGKKAPTSPMLPVRAGIENKVSPEEAYTGNDRVLIDYLKILAEQHFWSDIEKLTTTSSWTEIQSKYILSLIYNESDIWDTYYDGLEGIIENLHLTAEDQKKLLTMDKQGNDDSPIIRGLAANADLNQETLDAIISSDNDEAQKILYAKDYLEPEDRLFSWEQGVSQSHISEYTNADLVTAPGVKVEDLFELARYGKAEVRQRVAEQENISLEIFDLLMLDNNYDVLKSLAGNANLPKEHFRPLFDKVINAECLYFTPESHTYHTLAGQQISSPPLGEYWLNIDQKNGVKVMLLSNHHKHFDALLLKELAQDPNVGIRMHAIANSHLPLSLLNQISLSDLKRRVRKAAKNEFNRRKF